MTPQHRTNERIGICLILVVVAFVSSCSNQRQAENSAAEKPAPAAPAPPGPAAPAPQNAGEQNPAGGEPTSRKRALLVGINKYKYPDRVSPLAGSLNDVEDMKALLIGKFEFPPENVLVLKDAQATHEGIIGAIQNHLIAKAQKDDIVVFHYSGHGSQMKDVTGTRISGLDETLVPFDSRDPAAQVFDISGAELHGLLLQLAAKTKNITFILDSCHSGTLVRGARVRGVKADTRTPPSRLPDYAVATRGLGQVDDNKSTVRYAFIAGATSKESAFEHLENGKEHGALTYFLTRALRASKAGATYRDVIDNVAGNVTANYPAQHPQLEGAGMDQSIFGDAESLAQSYVPASPLDATRVSLGAGQVQGVSLDSTYDVYKPGTRKFAPPEKPVARIQVTRIDPFTAEGKIVSGGEIPKFSRAVEREHRYGTRRLRIYFDVDGPQLSPALQSIKAALTMLPYIEVVDDQRACHVQIRETGGRVLTLAADSTTTSTPVASSAPDLVDRLSGQIRAWAKWFNVLSIRNTQPDVDIEFSISTIASRDALALVGRPDVSVAEGEVIEAVVKNVSTRDLYVSILDLSSDGSIEVVYPSEPGADAVLKPGLSLATKLTTFVPKGRSIVTDILKVFASTKPIDLTPVTGKAIRDIPEGDPLQDLLMDAAGVPRGTAAVSAKPLNLGGWTTAQKVLVVRRK